MRFNRRARLDTGEVRDQRGRSGRTVAAGAGGMGIIGVIIAVLISALGGGGAGGGGSLGGALSDLQAGPNGGAAPADAGAGNEQIDQTCQTGADANQRDDCLIVGVVNSVQDYWTAEFERSNLTYAPAFTNFFTQGVSTGCGSATSAVGPFYCPADQQIYIDLGFFDEVESRFGASGGDFARAYVVAHEYGHHVQNLLGFSAIVQQSGNREGPESDGVRLELQADCLAGVWTRHATTEPDAESGVVLIADLTDQDIADALSAASAVGDDRIQESTTGQINPESWTHGSSEQRQDWFRVGLETGDADQCNTFEADDLLG